ncbi:MAG: gephyrin-like molybdotransferase Glp [Parvibaculaceae bacterium]
MALLPVDEARARILKGVKPLPHEPVALKDALGRVLAKPLKATRDQPPFDASAMDGYAVRAADAGEAPTRLKLIGSAPAGQRFEGRLGRGEAVRIFTGAPLPPGADAIVIQENADLAGDEVTVRAPAVKGKHIRRRGLDFRRGETVIEAPLRLNPRMIGLSAAMNHAELPVHRKPSVAILATGDELVSPGGSPAPDQIVTSNTSAISSLVRLWGAAPQDLGIARDTMAATAAAIARAEDAHVLVTTGGASVGEHDLVRQTLQALGFRIGFWKIAMRPGKPLMFATRGVQRVIGLPGNPVSAIICARLFLKPLIDRLLGLDEPDVLIEARLASPLFRNDERQDYLRARLGVDAAGRTTVTPFSVQDSSMQRLLASADALIVRPPRDPARKAGAKVKVLKLDF